MYCRPCIPADPVDTYAFRGKDSKDSGNKLHSSRFEPESLRKKGGNLISINNLLSSRNTIECCE